MRLTPTALSVIAIAGLALAALTFVLVLIRAIRDRARARERAALPPNERLQAIVEGQTRAIERLEAAVGQLAKGQRRLGELMQDAIRYVGVVRFDAFDDMGGHLSFSAALLDEHGDGVVITSINGRQDTRCYAKQVRGGTSIHNLSDEEEHAIREALGGPRRVVEAS